MRFLSLILLTASFFSLKRSSAQAPYKNRTNILNFSPLRLVDPLHSGVEIGYEKLYGHFSTQVFAAHLFRSAFNETYTNYNGFRLGAEQKYFLPLRPNKYISAETSYLLNRFETVGLFRHDSTNTANEFQYRDSIRLRRQIIALNLKYGQQVNFRRLVFDLSWGLGLRYRNIQHKDKILPGDKLVGPRHPNIHHYANSEKKNLTLNIPMNMRIGFSF